MPGETLNAATLMSPPAIAADLISRNGLPPSASINDKAALS